MVYLSTTLKEINAVYVFYGANTLTFIFSIGGRLGQLYFMGGSTVGYKYVEKFGYYKVTRKEKLNISTFRDVAVREGWGAEAPQKIGQSF